MVSLKTVTVPKVEADPDYLEQLKVWLLQQVALPVDELAQQLAQRQVEYDQPGPAPPAAAANGQLNITPLTTRGFKKPKFKEVNLAELWDHSTPEAPPTQEIYARQG